MDGSLSSVSCFALARFSAVCVCVCEVFDWLIFDCPCLLSFSHVGHIMCILQVMLFVRVVECSVMLMPTLSQSS